MINLTNVVNGDDAIAEDNKDELFRPDLLDLHLNDRLLVVGVGLQQLNAGVELTVNNFPGSKNNFTFVRLWPQVFLYLQST
jgi:hypothetical protein